MLKRSFTDDVPCMSTDSQRSVRYDFIQLTAFPIIPESSLRRERNKIISVEGSTEVLKNHADTLKVVSCS